MQKYTHLTLEQRYQISALLKSNISISEIARQIGCHKSTISREIKRNTGKQRSLKGQDRRGQIANRIDIIERPSIIEQRIRQGIMGCSLERMLNPTIVNIMKN